MATALVTGGTSGIGNAFVRELAARGDDVVVVARDTERMQALADELTAAHGVRIECITADLSVAEDITRVADWIEDPAHELDLLVNNAGFGLHAKLLDKDKLDTQRRAMDVMGFAVLQLSAAAGRAMVARGHGNIINVASTSAWIYSGNYSAIKAWCLSFTTALDIELQGTGVRATALCPGWVHTEFHQRSGASTDNLPGIVWVDPQVLVREALEDAAAGRTVSIPTQKWKAAIVVAQHFPRWGVRFLSRKLSSSRHNQKAKETA
ncbi:SDR family NAD(P)-dependent oxidoreductase [Luteococcus peritonei]|uniref:SDR family NAD(P)-dependent oxidoreductase n=1 Tax=Luteococcus peritonei TaxID=88874 RepID=A0ABW4RT41_9ACTN